MDKLKIVIDRLVADCDATLIYWCDLENAVLISESTYNRMWKRCICCKAQPMRST